MLDLPRPLRDAICAEPDDDGVRLIAADWLEQEGDPERARFIRWSIKREQLGQDPFGLEPLPQNAEFRRLLLSQDHGSERLPPHGVIVFLPYRQGEVLDAGHLCFSYRRGFIEDVRCRSHRDWTRWGPALVREHPIRTVAVQNLEPNYCYLVGSTPGNRWHVWWQKKRDYVPGTLVFSYLPRKWFSLLNEGQPTPESGRAYCSEAEAYRDLSQAMVQWARTAPAKWVLPRNSAPLPTLEIDYPYY